MSKLRKRAVLQGAMVTLVLLAIACGDDAADDAADTSGTAVTSSREQTAHDEEVSNSQSFDSSAALDEDGDGYFTEREVRQAIRMTVEDYQWPELYTPSADVIVYYFSGGRSVEDLEGSLSEVGTEHTLIGGWHECAWYMTWLDAFQSGDSLRQAEALQVMTDILPDNPSLGDGGGVEVLTGIAQSAALGDPAEVMRMVEGMGCHDRAFDIAEAQERMGE